ncbi:threonine--tRNA ligase [Myxococcota bacterium]|nr:threonine--tRNA ligase [Myxococcota bacterium]
MKKQVLDKNSQLYKYRHSLAHVMAQAVLSYFADAKQGDVKLGIGPPIDTGFYYDFMLPRPLEAEDLKEIEQRMKKIIKEKQTFERFVLPAQKAVEFLQQRGEEYKLELVKEFIEQGEEISFYTNGPFTDMCEGPHVEKTSDLPFKAFKLDSIAGAYWRGDEKNVMMTRIYGLAFETPEELVLFEKRRKLAQERDHRKLGRELDLFTISEDVGKGLPLWMPKGTAIRDSLEQLARETEFAYGYDRVATPHITQSKLYHISGHLPYYKDSMYPPMILDDEEYYLKPMNCPHHHTICKALIRSYRDLPLRLAEYGQVYRFERSGELAGLLRVRGMYMNDAHLYCDESHVRDELKKVMEMHKYYYDLFGLSNYWVRLSVHDQNKDKFVDNFDEWDKTVNLLRGVLQEIGIDYEEVAGEAAFYGPKIDFQVSNVVGREETASTNQLDFTSGPRFQLEYTGPDGQTRYPYIIHRAPLGTHERFISFLIEHYGGAFPTWLAPIQARVIPVAPEFFDYADKVRARLRQNSVRAEADLSNDSFSKKIRNGTVQKIPNLLIVGGNERDKEDVTLRRYGQKEQETFGVEAFAAWIADEIRLRRNSHPANPLEE